VGTSRVNLVESEREIEDGKENTKADKESCESQSGKAGQTQKESARSRCEANYNEVEDPKNL
jgi:hypothetical protein